MTNKLNASTEAKSIDIDTRWFKLQLSGRFAYLCLGPLIWCWWRKLPWTWWTLVPAEWRESWPNEPR